MNGISGAFRIVSNEIKTLQQLRMPAILEELVERKKGFILVTGPTGSGKSTSLAAMIHAINSKKRDHIITIEDPIEYVHSPMKSLIHQREVGIHAVDFSSALRSALREDPDVILVGEMRDQVTIENALRAAETGHLVLSTLHTNSAAETIDRIINVFPAENQQQVRQLLASTLIGVLSQRLVPRAMEKDRVAVMEILINTDAVKNLIREGKTHQIDSAIQTGSDFGMQSFERSFMYLKQNNVISPQLVLHEFV
jgi:twitching motility protein PilT